MRNCKIEVNFKCQKKILRIFHVINLILKFYVLNFNVFYLRESI